MNRTKIEWCDLTWNPIRARSSAHEFRTGTFCTRMSPGCKNCYASIINRRFGTGEEYEVPNLARHKFFIDERILEEPLRRKKPARIFVGDMFDLFHEAISDADLSYVFATMMDAQQHTFQLLTKRAARMRDFVGKWCNTAEPNIWLGVSVEDQPRANERIPILQATPAAVRFLSVEPMLEAIRLPRQVFLRTGLCGDWPIGHTTRVGGGNHVAFSNPYGALSVRADDGKLLGIKPGEFQDKGLGVDWVICGGESGPGARPMHLEWAESLQQQCAAANAAFFMKQFGSNPVWPNEYWKGLRPPRLHDRKGGDTAEWPEHLRVREFPSLKSAEVTA